MPKFINLFLIFATYLKRKISETTEKPNFNMVFLIAIQFKKFLLQSESGSNKNQEAKSGFMKKLRKKFNDYLN